MSCGPLIRGVMGVGAGRRCTRGNTLFYDAMILGTVTKSAAAARPHWVGKYALRTTPVHAAHAQEMNAVGSRAPARACLAS